MSLSKYILENCDGNLRYRVNFTGTTSLNVGETWFVECGGIQSGCYQVLNDTDEVLMEYNSDECTFVEFDDCDGCETSNDIALVAEDCYRWDPCTTGPTIYIPISYDNYDFIEYSNFCFYRRDVIFNTTPTITSVGSTAWRTSCEVCADYLGQSTTPCYSYTACPDDPRSFEINNAYAWNTSEYDTILYPSNGVGAGSQVLYLRNTETGQQKCFTLVGATTKSRIPTTNVEYIEDYTNCTDCELACDAQDIIIYFDNRAFTTVQGQPRFEAMKEGILNYLESIEDDINNDSIRVGIYRKNPSCNGGDGQVLALNDTYSDIVNSVTNMTFNSFDKDEYTVYQDMYDELTGNNSREGATATILWLTDTFFTSYGHYCWTGPQLSPVKANFLTLAKMGWVNGIGGKQVRVQIVEDIAETTDYYTNWYGTESVASTPEDYISTTWENFSGTTGSWQDITDIVCDEFVTPGDGFNTYLAYPCCTGPLIYVGIDSGYTPTMGSQFTSDGFEYGGICYWLKNQVSTETYSGQTVGVIYTGDVVSQICTDTSDPEPNCNCGKVYKRRFENCCDSSDTITIGYDSDVAGDPSLTDGFIDGSGKCYVYDGTGNQSGSLSDYWADEWVSNICDSDDCPTCPTPTPSVSATVSTTPTLTQTPSITPSVSLTQTPSVTPTISLTPSPPAVNTAQKFSACTNIDVIAPYSGETYVYEGTYGTYNMPTVINTVCDLYPLATGSTLTVSSYAIWDAITASQGTYADTTTYLSVHAEQTGAPLPTTTATQLAFISKIGNPAYDVVFTDPSISGSCTVPNIIYSTGLTVNCTGGTETTGCTFTIEIGDRVERCATYLGEVSQPPPYYVVSATTEHSDCNTCLGLCNPQDIVVLMDQSGSVGSVNWQDMQAGVIAIADDLENRMNLGEVRMAAIRWSNCGNTNLIQGLTSNHTTFTNAVDTAPFNGGGTYASQALSDAYDLLEAGNLSAEKSIILITDGGISDFNNQSCGIPSTSQLANQMKAGTYDSGVSIKIYTVNITNGNNLQLNSLSSGPEFQFSATDFDDFVDNVSGQIADNSCEENPFTGDSYNWYEATPCCTSFGLSDIIVALETGTTPTLTTDGFLYNGNCYTFNAVTGDTFSGSSVYTVLPNEIISSACSDSRCDCNNLEKIFLRNCCDSSDKIQILYSGSTPTEGQGLQYSGNCYYYKGDTSGVDVGITTDTLIDDICTSGYCECTVSGCGLQDIVVLVDQSGSIVSDFDDIKAGVVNIADSLQGNMDTDEVRIGIIKWSTCSNVDEVIDLTNNHTSFVNSANNMVPEGGGTQVGAALEQAYIMLNGANSRVGAEKNILLITDGQIGDMTNACSVASASATQLASQMTLGIFSNGVQVKIQTIGVGNGINFGQLQTLASSPDLTYTADFDTFATDIADQIAINSCDESPVGDNPDLVYWNASGCCDNLNLTDIVVAVSADTTVVAGYSFLFNSVCYSFTTLAGDSSSGSTVDFIYETNIYTDGCSNSRCGDCNTDYKLYELQNCCDATDTITIIYTGGTTTQGHGLEYQGECYQFKGDTGTGTPVINTDTLLPNICTNGPTSGFCGTCGTLPATPTPSLTQTPRATETPTATPSITSTPSITVTPSITPTNTLTPSPSPTIGVSMTPTLTMSVSPTNSASITPTPTPTRPTVSNTQTPTPTVTPTNTVTPSITATPTVTPSEAGTEVWEAEACCDDTDTILVSVPSPQTKVFVFYDGTSLDGGSATQASNSVREWYQDKVNDGDLSEGTLYEGVIGANGANGENWMWWMSYPYLGSLTGGTLSTGTQINEFGSDSSDVVQWSIANSNWCQNSTGECRPKATEFNDGDVIYRRINRGQDTITGLNDTRSNGVPFDHTTGLNNGTLSGPGTFNGGIDDYIVILVVDESDGAVGLYHPRIEKSNLTVDGFSLYSVISSGNQWWETYAGNQPSTRFEADYEAYLQVWRDIQLIGGRVNGLVYPVIDSNNARIPFPLHCLGAVEGETITSSEFNTKYGEPVTSVGPENIDCSLITTNNPYSTLTTTTAYQNLPLQYQNGAGLKNFGIQVDPTVYSFTSGVVGDSLDDFLDSTDLSTGYGFNNAGTCYYFTQETTGTPALILKWSEILPDYCDDPSCLCPSVTPSVTPTSTPTPTPSPSNLPGCVSGTTSGSYRFTDCCGVEQIGSSLGKVFCVDTSLSYLGIDLTYNECTPDCDEGPLSITFSASPNCGSLGSIFIDVEGGTKPYTIINTVPGTVPTQQGNGPFTFNSLVAGTYVFNISDNTLPEARSITQQIIVPDCFDATITAVDVPCNGSGGSIIVSGDSNSFPYSIVLYQNGSEYQTVQSDSPVYEFEDNITPTTYYAVVTDGSNQVVTTSTVTVSNANTLDYDVVVTGASPCNTFSNGFAEVTNLTGTPPYTFNWSNGQTTQIINNITAGNASVTVTDSNGCVKVTSFVVPTIDPLGISSVTGTQPDCFNCNGSLTFTATGGTAPYTFSASTGEIQSGGSTFTINNLCGGSYTINVQDSGQCNINSSASLTSTAGFSVVSVLSENSDCGENGTITVNVEGVVGVITYSITGNTGYNETVTSTNQTHTFENLESDIYTIEIESNSGCVYTTTKEIQNEDKFTISTTVTETTCGSNNGGVLITVNSGTTALQYPLSYTVKRVSDNFIVYNNLFSTDNFLNLTTLDSGSYEISVTDNNSCKNTEYFTVASSQSGVQTILYSTNCVNGNDGTATLEITDGTAPFTIVWSNGVTDQTNLSGLSGGTYTATVTDSNGCQSTKSTVVICDNEDVEDYVINTLCEQEFVTNSQGKRGFYEMLNEAFLDLNTPGENCTFNSATFTGILTISGGSYGVGQTLEDEFYTTTSLTDVPSDNEWETVVEGLLEQFTGITYTVDILNNIFTISGDCDGDEDPTNGAYVDLRIEIELDIQCNGREVTPTPSATISVTPTVTPTNTVTPSITPTVTTTSSVTPSISITPTVTATPSTTTTPQLSITPTQSVTTTPSVTVTPSLTNTPSLTVTPSLTNTPSVTVTPSLTNTPSVTITPSVTSTQTVTPTPSVTVTPSLTNTPSVTITPSVTSTQTVTPTPSVTSSASPTPGVSTTPTPTITVSPTVTPTNTPSVTVTPSLTNTPSVTVTPSLTNTPSVTVTPSLTNTPSVTVTPSLTNTPSITVTPSVTVTPSLTNTPSVTVTPSLTNTPSVTVTPSLTNTPTLTQTPTPSTTPPALNCDLVVVGSGRQLSCTLEVSGVVRALDCNLVVSGSFFPTTPTPSPTPSITPTPSS